MDRKQGILIFAAALLAGMFLCPAARATEAGMIELLYGSEAGLQEAAGEDPIAVAILTARSLPRKQSREEVYYNVSMALARAGEHKKALAVAKAIDGIQFRFHAYKGLSEFYIEAGKFRNARRVLDDVFEEIKLVSRYDPDYPVDMALTAISWNFSQAKGYKQALRTAKTISDPRLRAEALAKIGGEYLKAGRKPASGEKKLLDELRTRASEKPPVPQPR